MRFLLLLLAAGALLPAPAGAAKRPNVLFIVCDDLNTHLAFDGYGPIQTPHLDKFSKRALTFERAYCQYPVCNPSRTSFLSGRYPEATGILDNRTNVLQLHP
ncbi:MAG: sulfatase-like hydrolase/transferase, partial [Akkermansiaceae bacterium]|nr:sulfatase-like hydrolase/transferase [Akkermansiaceae bacterium]